MCSKYSIIDINTKKTIIDNIEIIKNTNYLKLTKEEQTTLYNFKDNSFIQNINIKLTITSEDSKEYVYLIEKDSIEKTYYLSNKNKNLEVVSFNDIDIKPEVKTFSISIEVNTNMSAKEITDVVLEKLSKNIK